jgi:LTXXQ motif family protein
MRAHVLGTLAVMLTPLASGVAQQPDSAGLRRADSLRHRIEERFASRVQEQLGLTDDQTKRLRATGETFGTRRRELRDRERLVRTALWKQLQPGVAADRDSVAKLTDAMIDLKLRSAQAARDEMNELSKYLNPVQRARLYVMREQFYHRVKEAHDHRGRGRRHKHKDRSWM